MKRILLMAATAMLLSFPVLGGIEVAAPSTAAAAGPVGEMVDDDGGSGCINGSLYQENTWRWIAYIDGGGYWRVWSDVWVCTNAGWEYVGGFWN